MDRDNNMVEIGYYDKSKFRAKNDQDSNFRILGFFRKGTRGGGMISAEQAQAESSTYNGWNDR